MSNNTKNEQFLKQFQTGVANPKKIAPMPPAPVILKDANGKVTGIGTPPYKPAPPMPNQPLGYTNADGEFVETGKPDKK